MHKPTGEELVILVNDARGTHDRGAGETASAAIAAAATGGATYESRSRVAGVEEWQVSVPRAATTTRIWTECVAHLLAYGAFFVSLFAALGSPHVEASTSDLGHWFVFATSGVVMSLPWFLCFGRPVFSGSLITSTKAYVADIVFSSVLLALWIASLAMYTQWTYWAGYSQPLRALEISLLALLSANLVVWAVITGCAVLTWTHAKVMQDRSLLSGAVREPTLGTTGVGTHQGSSTGAGASAGRLWLDILTQLLAYGVFVVALLENLAKTRPGMVSIDFGDWFVFATSCAVVSLPAFWCLGRPTLDRPLVRSAKVCMADVVVSSVLLALWIASASMYTEGAYWVGRRKALRLPEISLLALLAANMVVWAMVWGHTIRAWAHAKLMPQLSRPEGAAVAGDVGLSAMASPIVRYR